MRVSAYVAEGSNRCSILFHCESAVSNHQNAIGNEHGSDRHDLTISIEIDLESQSVQSDFPWIFIITRFGLLGLLRNASDVK